jgi:hypothetical protein
MHRNIGLGVGLFLCGSLVAGCDVLDDAGGANIDPRLQIGNGQVLNSAVLNGIQFNGIQFNGIQFNGSSFSGTLDAGGVPVQKSGLDFIGAEIKLSTLTSTYTLRFDDIRANPDQPGSGVYLYAITWKDDAIGTWSSLCHDVAGTPVEAIPIANYWDTATGARTANTDVITFACRGAVLAKCVEWGYIPWASATQCDPKGKNCVTVALADHHQACTRMARADYCGNGRSYTFDGTPIDVFDRLNPKLQLRTTSSIPDWKIEAEWGPNGATCIGDELRLQMLDDLGLDYVFPSCIDAIDDIAGCGTLHASRPASKIANAYCEKWTSNPDQCADVNDDDHHHGH